MEKNSRISYDIGKKGAKKTPKQQRKRNYRFDFEYCLVFETEIS